jgi:hypothetical protein
MHRPRLFRQLISCACLAVFGIPYVVRGVNGSAGSWAIWFGLVMTLVGVWAGIGNYLAWKRQPRP